MSDRIQSFQDFYPYYLSEHRTGPCRVCHFIGTIAVLGIATVALIQGTWLLLALLPVAGYGGAWVGHFVFERNRPATFTYPLYSLAGDFVMFRDILVGRVPLVGDLPQALMEGPFTTP